MTTVEGRVRAGIVSSGATVMTTADRMMTAGDSRRSATGIVSSGVTVMMTGGSRPGGRSSPPWGNRDDDRRGSRPGGDRQQWGNRDDSRGPRQDDRRGSRPSGDRQQWGNRDDDRRGSRPGGDRQQWGNRDDDRRGSRPGGDRQQWGNRDDDRRGSRPSGDRQQWGNRDDDRRGNRQDDRRGSRPRGERQQWGNRDDDRRGSRPSGDRPQWGNRDDRRPDRRSDEPERPRKPGTTPRADEPDTPRDFVESELPVGVRAELKGLPKDLAETVGAHIWAAGQLVDVDPDLAFRHAEAARRRAGRLPIVREAAAETAYAAGEYAVALREFRAIRRMSGGDELIPVIADCERALGRPRDALEVLGELDPKSKDIWLRIECLLVEAGVRADLGQTAEAMRLLQAAISRKVGPALRPGPPALRLRQPSRAGRQSRGCPGVVQLRGCA